MSSVEEEDNFLAFAEAAQDLVEAHHISLEVLKEKDERREEILKLVQTGQMEPLVADQIVEDEVLYPLSTNPHVNSIDVFKLPHWTIEMVLAWIIGRHREDVLLFHDPFRTKIVIWKPLVSGDKQTGYELVYEEPASIRALDLHALQSLDEDADERSEAAKVKLWAALEKGSIRAAAYDMLNKGVVTIAEVEWAYLTFSDTEAQPATLRFKSSNETRYSDIKFKSVDVRALWPPRGDPTEPRWFSPHPHSIYRIDEHFIPEACHVISSPDVVEGSPTDDDCEEIATARNSKRARVKHYILQIFPDGIPTELSDSRLSRLIADAMDEAAKKNPLLEKAPSRETILRAAGRKRK